MQRSITNISILVLIISLLYSCDKITNEISFTGEIINPTSDRVWITIDDSLHSTLLDAKNRFKFELSISEPNRYRFDHGEHTYVFLKPQCDLDIILDAANFDNSILYSGKLQEENQYIKKRLLLKEGLEERRFEIPNMNREEFDHIIHMYLDEWEESLLALSQIEDLSYSNFKAAELNELNKIRNIVNEYYESLKELTPGKNAKDFKCIDKYGRIYTLKDFKNKNICIDVWASWCTACFKEMQYFDSLMIKYQNYNIEFIGISVDDQIDVWNQMLEFKELPGIQLWAEGGSKSEFYDNYKLLDLPAYILIDKNGRITKSRAPRPSENLEDEIIKILNL